jgi:hypothetical protein
MKGGAKRRKTSARGERRKGERRERGNKMNRRERRRREKETAAGGSVGASLSTCIFPNKHCHNNKNVLFQIRTRKLTGL